MSAPTNLGDWVGSAIGTVFLDRDGVINAKMPEGKYVRSVEEFRILPDVPGAISRLNRTGIRVLVVSNQRGIALGLYTIADVEAIHNSLQTTLAKHGARIDRFYICPHNHNSCACRKPLTGMFAQAHRDFQDLTSASCVMIGDSASDIEFGQNAGMRTILIAAPAEPGGTGGAAGAAPIPTVVCASLAEAVDAILRRGSPRS